MFATYQVKQLRSQKSFINNVIITRTHNITVNPVQDRRDGGCINCRANPLANPFCCVTQTLVDAGLLCMQHYSTVNHNGWCMQGEVCSQTFNYCCVLLVN